MEIERTDTRSRSSPSLTIACAKKRLDEGLKTVERKQRERDARTGKMRDVLSRDIRLRVDRLKENNKVIESMAARRGV